METKAIARYIRISPQKCRLVADQIRMLPAGRALEILEFSSKKAAKPIRKVLKRWRPRAKGRAAPIIKRTCHITVTVTDNAGRSL